MYCKRCGHSDAGSRTRCRNCGTPLPQMVLYALWDPRPRTDTFEHVCPNCGGELVRRPTRRED